MARPTEVQSKPLPGCAAGVVCDGTDTSLAYALHSYILGHHSPEHTHRQAELASERIELGDVATAAHDLQAMERIADELGQPSQASLVRVYQALFHLLQGRYEEAETLLPYADRVAIGYPEICLGAVARALGRLAAVTGRRAEALTDAAELNRRIGAHPWVERCEADLRNISG